MNSPHVKKKNIDIPTRIIGSFTDEIENVADSIKGQIMENTKSIDNGENPIVEAMRETSEKDAEDGKLKSNTTAAKRKFIRSREELDADLKKIQMENQEKFNAWSEQVGRQMKIVEPGENLPNKDVVIPLTSKPKRGMIQGRPGTAKGGTGMEVVKSKQ